MDESDLSALTARAKDLNREGRFGESEALFAGFLRSCRQGERALRARAHNERGQARWAIHN